ncbi:hypothetical protein VTP01DRAFT_5962 [Rhizomucor pusillus]|uniref:uncharacterized protein n=1 Tax=Rhizomucor pusillus TaxID=4840 RepID=UPI0037429FBC
MGILDGPIPLTLLKFDDDGLPTESSIAQKHVEENVLRLFKDYAPHNVLRQPLETVSLKRQEHVAYLKKGLSGLSHWMAVMDASKPWLLYWILHSLELLEEKLTPEERSRGIATVAKWQQPNGGFGGGSEQISHLATTYAAVNSLAILGGEEAYKVIDRDALYAFLLSMKQSDGSFTMHQGGEIDIRGSYCALTVAALTNLLTPELTANCAEFICRSQTYEGGIGPYPGKEAHNGYTYCGIAALEVLGELKRIDLDKLIKWCVDRQMQLEGGFQGRTNKLVDGCYSFWGAGDFPLLRAELQRRAWREQGDVQDLNYLFDREALQEYILLCCQSESGGLLDKPGSRQDHYHTCYCLSGLSTSQHLINFDIKQATLLCQRGADAFSGGLGTLMWTRANEYVIVGSEENCLAATHPVYNVGLDSARNMVRYFYSDELAAIVDILPNDEEPMNIDEQ